MSGTAVVVNEPERRARGEAGSTTAELRLEGAQAPVRDVAEFLDMLGMQTPLALAGDVRHASLREEPPPTFSVCVARPCCSRMRRHCGTKALASRRGPRNMLPTRAKAPS